MKFLHTADWQIGMKYVHLGNAGESVRKIRIRSARRLMDRAAEEKVDFVLLAGDTFEDNAVDRATVKVIADILGGRNMPVYVIPGNHDPHQAGSVWEDACWKTHPNVSILLDPSPVKVPGGLLCPCPVLSKHSSLDPTSWIPVEASNEIRIAMAHGTANGWLPPEHNHDYPIATDLPERTCLDYVALGHIHSTKLFDAVGPPRMAYSGTHEPTGFGEPDSGNALLVEIEGHGASPKIRKIRTAALEWNQIHRIVGSVAELKAVHDELQALPMPEDKLVECRISGFLASGGEETEQQIKALVETVFLFGRYLPELKIDHRNSEWIGELPPGYLETAANALAAKALESSNDPVPARAIQMFSRIWQEVKP